MNKYILYVFSSLFFISFEQADAQVTLSNGEHVLEISGRLSTYYNERNLKPTNNNRNKDRFRLRDAQVQFEGRIRDEWAYELQVDFVDLAVAGTGEIDPENPGLMDAWVKYKGLDFMDIQVGYGKLPYSRNSLVPFFASPYWQRAQLTRGEFFSRRDAGITLSTSTWKQRIKLYAGAYTGLGEFSLRGDNDATGNLEYVTRAELAFPSRYRYRDIDYFVSPVPMFVVGANARYSDRRLPEGRNFPEDLGGRYGLRAIDGERYIYGFDVAFQYMGFSAQFEAHQMLAKPQSPLDPNFLGFTPEQTDGKFYAGGYIAQANYFWKKAKSIFSVRYEEFNINDLAQGKSQRFSPALAYQFNGFDAMVKFQYFYIISEEEVLDPMRWTEQWRVGFTLNFN